MRATGTARKAWRLFSLLGMAVAAIGLATSQVACKNDDYRSPTAPPAPAAPTPTIEGLYYLLLVEPANPDASYPLAGELLVDGRVVWSGELGEPDGAYTYYGDYFPPRNLSTWVDGAVPVGAHTMTFRLTEQLRSPTRYLLSGRIDVSWLTGFGGGSVVRAASWEGVEVRLSTGEPWSLPFTVSGPPPP